LITCTACKTEVSDLAIFPEDLCLACYSAKMESQPLPTAEELTAIWRNPKLLNL